MKRITISFILVLMLCSCTRFDQDIWLNEPEKRQDMISSLTFQYELKGMTESEIINLLGEPAESITKPSPQFLYYIGGAGLFGVKVSLLQIQFDEQGKVDHHDIIYK